jgi:hypothetical protein
MESFDFMALANREGGRRDWKSEDLERKFRKV